MRDRARLEYRLAERHQQEHEHGDAQGRQAARRSHHNRQDLVAALGFGSLMRAHQTRAAKTTQIERKPPPIHGSLKVFHEITHRVYLIIGAIAWLGLATLAATSTDGMVRRLGGLRWRRLHQAIYAIALLGLIHYFQQTKADVTVPAFTAKSVCLWLIGYRVLTWVRQDTSESCRP